MWPSKSLPRRSRPLRRQTEGNGAPVGFSSIIYHLADYKRRPARGAARAGWVVRAPLRRIPSHVGREPILARPPAGTAGASHLGTVLSGLVAAGCRNGAFRCALVARMRYGKTRLGECVLRMTKLQTLKRLIIYPLKAIAIGVLFLIEIFQIMILTFEKVKEEWHESDNRDRRRGGS